MHGMQRLVLAMAAWVGVQAGWAAQLGDLTVKSSIGAPFDATLTVADVAGDGKDISVRLAPTTAYIARAMAQDPQTLNFSLTLTSRNPFVLRITSENPISSPSFPLLMELKEGAAVNSRLYTVKLPSASTEQRQTASEKTEPNKEPSQTVVAQASVVNPEASTSEQPKPALPAHPNLASAAAPMVPAPPAQEEKKRVEENPPSLPKPELSQAPAATKQPPLPAPTDIVPIKAPSPQSAIPERGKAESEAKRIDKGDQGKKTEPVRGVKEKAVKEKTISKLAITETVQTRAGLTLWSTVTPYRSRYTGADTEQIIVAFIRRNPGCFPEGAVAFMRFGCTMAVPTLQEVRAVGKKEAHYYVQEAPQSDARKRR